MKTISIPTCDRVDLFVRCLESIKRAKDIESWSLVFSCEPEPRMIEIISVINWAPVYWNKNVVRMGCRNNTYLAAAFAYQMGSSFNLYLEDDLEISKDALVLADHFRKSGKPGILALRRWHKTEDSTKPMQVSPASHGLLGDGFAWHRSMWPTIQRYWFYYNPEMFCDMWDCSVDWGFIQNRVKQWRPLVPRSTNFGHNGTHCHDSIDLNRHSPCYNGCVPSFSFVE